MGVALRVQGDPKDVKALCSAPAYHMLPNTVTATVVRGAWVALLVKHPPLDFASGHDLEVMG